MSPTPTNHEAQLAEVLQAGFDCGVEDDTLTVGPHPLQALWWGHRPRFPHLPSEPEWRGHRASDRPHRSVDRR